MSITSPWSSGTDSQGQAVLTRAVSCHCTTRPRLRHGYERGLRRADTGSRPSPTRPLAVRALSSIPGGAESQEGMCASQHAPQREPTRRDAPDDACRYWIARGRTTMSRRQDPSGCGKAEIAQWLRWRPPIDLHHGCGVRELLWSVRDRGTVSAVQEIAPLTRYPGQLIQVGLQHGKCRLVQSTPQVVKNFADVHAQIRIKWGTFGIRNANTSPSRSPAKVMGLACAARTPLSCG